MILLHSTFKTSAVDRRLSKESAPILEGLVTGLVWVGMQVCMVTPPLDGRHLQLLA